MNTLYSAMTTIILLLAPPASGEKGDIEFKLSKHSTPITYILFYTNHDSLRHHHSLGVLGQPNPQLRISNAHTKVLLVYGHKQKQCREGKATAIRLEPSTNYKVTLNKYCELTMKVDS